MFKQKYVTILCCVFCFSAYAQDISPSVFAKANAFRHAGFKDGWFGDSGLGLSLFSNFWISPKAGIKFSFGNLEDRSERSQTINELVQTNYKGTLFTLGAKIRLTKPEDVWLFIWPEYSFGDLKFNSQYFKSGDNPTYLALQEISEFKQFHSWFDLAAGIELYADDDHRFLGSAYLVYTLMDIRSGFDQLSFETTSLRTPSKMNSSIGIGLSFEYCFCKNP